MSNNSGLANIGPSGIAGKGKIIAGALEMSNVDMADQFVDMIVTQRGFQANSRTIQTADQLLQELLTLKR
jgi:flagellar hook protein FlgE